MVTFISDLERAAGALAGLAIGDALGAPIEGCPPPRRPIRDMEPGGRFRRPAGRITDDTAQAAAVAESLAFCRGFCPEDIVRRLVAGFVRHPEYYGPTSTRVFSLVMGGVPPYRAAALAHRELGSSRSNGSVMRGPPIGIFYRGPAVGEISRCCSRLTHFDPVAGECSAFLNRMVSELCRGTGKEKAFSRALSACRNAEVGDYLGDWEAADPEPGLDALLCTHASVSVFLSTNGFEEALVKAVNLGGDADTVGACTGSLAGARYGSGAIPGRWLSRLEERGYLRELSYRLWASGWE